MWETASPHQVQVAWDAQQRRYDSLRLAGKKGIQNDLLRAACHGQPVRIGCIDERDPIMATIAGIGPLLKLPIAGSGVLLNSQQRLVVVQAIKSAELNVKAVSYHAGCGACQAVAHQLREDNVDRLAEQTARQLAEAFNIVRPLRSWYETGADIAMIGQPSLHHARALVISGTPVFNPHVLGWPEVFHVSARFAPDDEALRTEVGFAISIASGDYGVGRGRLRQQPLLVVIVGDSTNSAFSVESIVKRISSILSTHQDILEIIRVVAPSA